MDTLRKYLLTGLLVTLALCWTVAQTSQLAFHRAVPAKSNTNLAPGTEAGLVIFQENPLLLNGRTLDLQTFSMDSRGSLSVIGQDAELMTVVKVPFRIYLSRHGAMVNLGASDPEKIVTSVAVEEVLNKALPGDYLVIEPARPGDWQAKRSIRLVKYFDWLRFAIGKRDGC